jgi:hypothetical protein
MTEIDLFTVVALLEDIRGNSLRRDQVGTVVEHLAPGVYEVEFSDTSGQTYASLAVRAAQVMCLHYAPCHHAG